MTTSRKNDRLSDLLSLLVSFLQQKSLYRLSKNSFNESRILSMQSAETAPKNPIVYYPLSPSTTTHIHTHSHKHAHFLSTRFAAPPPPLAKHAHLRTWWKQVEWDLWCQKKEKKLSPLQRRHRRLRWRRRPLGIHLRKGGKARALGLAPPSPPRVLKVNPSNLSCAKWLRATRLEGALICTLLLFHYHCIPYNIFLQRKRVNKTME